MEGAWFKKIEKKYLSAYWYTSIDITLSTTLTCKNIIIWDFVVILQWTGV